MSPHCPTPAWLFGGLSMDAFLYPEVLLTLVGLVWGMEMLLRKVSLREIFGYTAYWAVAVWVLVWIFRRPIF